MTQRRIFILLLSMLVYMENTYANDSDVVVIVNKKAPQLNLDRLEIEKIYTGKVTLWCSKEPICVTTNNEEEIHKTFLKQYVKRTPSQFKNTWRTLLFTGKGKIPTHFQEQKKVIEFVANNRHAIGYIRGQIEDTDIKCIIP